MIKRPEFEATLTAHGFKLIVEDLPDDAAILVATKSCLHGCPFQQHVIDAHIYNEEHLQLLLDDIRAGDCPHPPWP